MSPGARLRLNQWALGGDWTVRRQAVVLDEANGRIAYRFHARDLNLVMAPGAKPCLVVNGIYDNMIPIRNSYALAEHLPRAMLLTYPDAGHGSLFQFHESLVTQASLLLDSEVL